MGYFLFFEAAWSKDDPKAPLYSSLFSFSLTTLIVGGVGGIAAYFTDSWERQRQARSEVEATFSRVIEAYNELKLVRRVYRPFFKSKGDCWEIDGKNYLSMLSELNRVQLKFEAFKRVFENHPSAFSLGDSDALAADFSCLEKVIAKACDDLRHLAANGDNRSIPSSSSIIGLIMDRSEYGLPIFEEFHKSWKNVKDRFASILKGEEEIKIATSSDY